MIRRTKDDKNRGLYRSMGVEESGSKDSSRKTLALQTPYLRPKFR